MSRASFLKAVPAALLGLASLVACGGSDGPGKAADLAQAAQGVNGVASADLHFASGAGGSKFISGDVRLDTADPNEGSQVLGNIYTAMAPMLTGGDSSYVLDFVTTTSSGETVSPTSLGLSTLPKGFDIVDKFGTTG